MAEILKIFVAGEPEPQPSLNARIAGPRGKQFVHFYEKDKYPKDDPQGRAGHKMPWVIWREAVIRTVLSQHRPQAVTGPIRLTMSFDFPRPQYLLKPSSPMGRILHTVKPDGDNLQKLIQDAFTKLRDIVGELGVWKDDAQICSWGGDKYWVARGGKPGAWIIVETLEEAEPVLFEPAPVTTSGPTAEIVPMREIPVKPVRPKPRMDLIPVLLDYDGQPVRKATP